MDERTTVYIYIQVIIYVPVKHPYSNKRPHSAKLPYSNIIILVYGYVSTEVHLPLIAHKRTVMPHYKTSIPSRGSSKRTSDQKAFIYGY